MKKSDDATMYRGYGADTIRWTDSGSGTPTQDRPGWRSDCSGSAYSDTCNMAFCDGSVRAISYSTDAETHRCLGSRKNGNPIDGNKL